MHDIGTMTIEGIDSAFNVVEVLKVGKCVLHKLDRELPTDVDFKGRSVQGCVDRERRMQM